MHYTVLYTRYLPVHSSHVAAGLVGGTLRADTPEVFHFNLIPNGLINLCHPQHVPPVVHDVVRLAWIFLGRNARGGQVEVH
jgi:hypothetical protein